MIAPTTPTLSDAAQLKIVPLIAKELGAGAHQVAAAVALLDEGSTVPFIARYRKEATGNLDDTQLRTLEERLLYLRELEERRAAVLASIEEQGKLTDVLRASIEAAATKQAVEDLYLPFKPKRRTRAQIAREAGLEPLADGLLADPTLNPEQEALKYIRVIPAAEEPADLDEALPREPPREKDRSATGIGHVLATAGPGEGGGLHRKPLRREGDNPLDRRHGAGRLDP